jgi:peptide-methionine (R)-S-oxide reductase
MEYGIPQEKFKDHWQAGQYNCAQCNHPLFPSDAKFNSGTYWPSFRKALPGAIKTVMDYTHNMERIELLCANCNLHLGHVFPDGKHCGDSHPEAGERYCILSDVLAFQDR